MMRLLRGENKDGKWILIKMENIQRLTLEAGFLKLNLAGGKCGRRIGKRMLHILDKGMEFEGGQPTPHQDKVWNNYAHTRLRLKIYILSPHKQRFFLGSKT